MLQFREAWAVGKTIIGAWMVLPSTVVAEAVARMGFDYICLDLQHGPIDDRAAMELLQTIALCDVPALGRARDSSDASIGRLLDFGAHTVIVPMVNTAADAERVVRAARYSPLGHRSWGPTVASVRYPDYRSVADQIVPVIPMIETAEAVANIDEIAAVDGVEAVYVGPSDLSVSLGLAAAENDGHPRFDEALRAVVDGCRRHGVVPGMHTSAPFAERRLEQGFRMITVTNDLSSLRGAMAAELSDSRIAMARPRVTAV